MGERYLISGVQLGMFKVYCEEERPEKVEALINEIIDKQFLGRSKTTIEIDTEAISKITFKK